MTIHSCYQLEAKLFRDLNWLSFWISNQENQFKLIKCIIRKKILYSRERLLLSVPYNPKYTNTLKHVQIAIDCNWIIVLPAITGEGVHGSDLNVIS